MARSTPPTPPSPPPRRRQRAAVRLGVALIGVAVSVGTLAVLWPKPDRSLDTGEGTVVEADAIVREFNAVLPWLSYPGRRNRVVAAAELVW